MTHYPKSIRNVIQNLSKFPGIGEKTAERLAMYLLRMPRSDVTKLAESIAELKTKTRLCSQCFAFSDEAICKFCGDPNRDHSQLCVVEQPADLAAVEKSGAFKGLYHILQGALSPMEGIGPDDVRIKELLYRIKSGQVKEVVLATSTSVEGEATASYLAKCLQAFPVKITRIASGVPMGGDLKFVDQVTLRRAMETRHAV
jgi:recombination protein RecR